MTTFFSGTPSCGGEAARLQGLDLQCAAGGSERQRGLGRRARQGALHGMPPQRGSAPVQGLTPAAAAGSSRPEPRIAAPRRAPWRRRSTEEGAGPRGGDSPYVSPEGHALIDIRFCEAAASAAFFMILARLCCAWRGMADALPQAQAAAGRGRAGSPARSVCLPRSHPCACHRPCFVFAHTAAHLRTCADEGLKLFGEDADYGAIAREIEGVPGVVAHGLVSPAGPLPPRPACCGAAGARAKPCPGRLPSPALKSFPSRSHRPLPQMANVAAAAIVAGRDGAPPRLVWRGDAAGSGAA